MSIEKSEVKVAAAHEIGCRLDDALEATTKDLYRLEGAVTALKQAVQIVESIGKVVDKDMDDGRFGLEEATHIKQYLHRATLMVTNLQTNAESNRVAQTGKIQAMETAVKIAKNFKDAEDAKAQTLRTALAQARANGTSEERRPVGGHPGLTIKEQRLAEAAAQSASTEAPPAEEPTPSVEESPAPEPSTAPKRRGRKPKALTDA